VVEQAFLQFAADIVLSVITTTARAIKATANIVARAHAIRAIVILL
jgi:hypothetical protein